MYSKTTFINRRVMVNSVLCRILNGLHAYKFIAAPRNINGQIETYCLFIYASLSCLFRLLVREQEGDLTTGITHKHQQTLNTLSEFIWTFKLHRRKVKAFNAAVAHEDLLYPRLYNGP